MASLRRNGSLRTTRLHSVWTFGKLLRRTGPNFVRSYSSIRQVCGKRVARLLWIVSAPLILPTELGRRHQRRLAVCDVREVDTRRNFGSDVAWIVRANTTVQRRSVCLRVRDNPGRWHQQRLGDCGAGIVGEGRRAARQFPADGSGLFRIVSATVLRSRSALRRRTRLRRRSVSRERGRSAGRHGRRNVRRFVDHRMISAASDDGRAQVAVDLSTILDKCTRSTKYNSDHRRT